jgi:hypothetical protein
MMVSAGVAMAAPEARNFNSGTAVPVAVEDGLTGFTVHLKPMVFEERSGVAKAVDRAAAWVHGLELGWSGLDGLAAKLALPKAPSVETLKTSLAALPSGFDSATPATMFNAGAWNAMHSLSQATMNNSRYDGTWVLHPQPSAGYLSATGSGGVIVTRPTDTDSPIGRALAEQSLAGHNIEVGLPLSPWVSVAGARYWWGAQDMMPEVHGSRVGLKLTPAPYVEVEAGRMQDSERSNGAFVSARLSIPLGLP